jgi:hypothetical protein
MHTVRLDALKDSNSTHLAANGGEFYINKLYYIFLIMTVSFHMCGQNHLTFKLIQGDSGGKVNNWW